MTRKQSASRLRRRSVLASSVRAAPSLGARISAMMNQVWLDVRTGVEATRRATTVISYVRAASASTEIEPAQQRPKCRHSSGAKDLAPCVCREHTPRGLLCVPAWRQGRRTVLQSTANRLPERCVSTSDRPSNRKNRVGGNPFASVRRRQIDHLNEIGPREALHQSPAQSCWSQSRATGRAG